MWTSMAKRQYQPVDVQTRFLRLRQPAALADRIEGWTVCWLGGWDKGKIFFLVMVKKVIPRPRRKLENRPPRP